MLYNTSLDQKDIQYDFSYGMSLLLARVSFTLLDLPSELFSYNLHHSIASHESSKTGHDICF